MCRVSPAVPLLPASASQSGLPVTGAQSEVLHLDTANDYGWSSWQAKSLLRKQHLCMPMELTCARSWQAIPKEQGPFGGRLLFMGKPKPLCRCRQQVCDLHSPALLQLKHSRQHSTQYDDLLKSTLILCTPGQQKMNVVGGV